jgi:hypothetical protein
LGVKELTFEAGPMAINGNQWIVYARQNGESVKLIINVGEHQIQMIERAEHFVDAPCA